MESALFKTGLPHTSSKLLCCNYSPSIEEFSVLTCFKKSRFHNIFRLILIITSVVVMWIFLMFHHMMPIYSIVRIQLFFAMLRILQFYKKYIICDQESSGFWKLKANPPKKKKKKKWICQTSFDYSPDDIFFSDALKHQFAKIFFGVTKRCLSI